MHHRNIAYLIADSAHGRIVMWDRAADDYQTCVRIEDGAALEGEREEGRKKILHAFAGVLAEHVRQFASQRSVEGFVLAAPAKLLSVLKQEFKGGPAILGAVAKDLTKTPDHQLRDWLIEAELHAPAA